MADLKLVVSFFLNNFVQCFMYNVKYLLMFMYSILTQYTQLKGRFLPGLMISVIFMAVFTSCTSVKNTYYFKNLDKDTVFKGQPVPNIEAQIQKNDVLGISVSSLSTELDMKFNEAAVTSVAVAGGQGAGAAGGKGFLVGEDGKILMHFLGSVKVEGLTRKQLKLKLQEELLPYMKEPIITVEFLNKKVIVMGEVGGPKIVPIMEEKMSILELLINNGDITEKGDKSKVMIIRDTGTDKQVKMLDMEDHNIFSSPWFYLKPNDIVYVSAEKQQQKIDARLKKAQGFQMYFGFIGLATSLIFLFTNLFRTL